MAKVEKFSRIVVKRNTTSGDVPTIPLSGPSYNDHTLLPAWRTTDIYVGEFFLNDVDDKVWMRVGENTIKQLVFFEDSGATIDNLTTNSLYTTDIQIYSGVTCLIQGYGEGRILISDNNGNLSYVDISTLSTVVNITYNGLLNLISVSGLTIGKMYLISDYQTVHTIKNTNNINIGSLEPLLVVANGLYTLEPEAHSALYPHDIIYYDYNNNYNMIPGCTKGYIYRRIDTLQNNDIPFDFRNVKFRRWQIDASSNIWDSSITYNQNDVVLYPDTSNIYICISNSIIGVNPSTDNGNSWKLFEWSNLSYVSLSENEWYIGNIMIDCSNYYNDYNIFTSYDSTVFSNKISQNYSYGNILSCNDSIFFSNNISDNIIESNFNSNNIGYMFKYNNIGTNFSSNSIGHMFNYNNISSNFSFNSIGYEYDSNNIGSNFQYNTIGNNFYNNSIGSYFNNNSIGSYFINNSIISEFYNNSICSYFNNNVMISNSSNNNIGSVFSNNSVLSEFQYNNIGNSFINDNIGTNFSYNSIGDDFNNNTIGSNFSYNTIGSNYQMNLVCDNFGGLNFTSATHVHDGYSCELFISSTHDKKLIYDKITIVNSNA